MQIPAAWDSFSLWSPGWHGKLAQSLIAVLALWLVRQLIVWLVLRRLTDRRARYRARKATTYTISIFAAVIVARIWFAGVGPVATYAGLLSAGVAIALRDPIVSLAGWFYILWQRPFAVGDRIEIGETSGDVIDIGILRFTLVEAGGPGGMDQSTGRIIHTPNGQVFTRPIVNSTEGFNYIWNELAVLITFESDWRKAKTILTEIANRHGGDVSEAAEHDFRNAARRYMLLYSKLTPIVYTSVEDSGVMLTIRHLCPPRRRRDVRQAIWEDILDAFAACPDIDFAYPTRRIFDNAAEGKPGAQSSRPDASANV